MKRQPYTPALLALIDDDVISGVVACGAYEATLAEPDPDAAERWRFKVIHDLDGAARRSALASRGVLWEATDLLLPHPQNRHKREKDSQLSWLAEYLRAFDVVVVCGWSRYNDEFSKATGSARPEDRHDTTFYFLGRSDLPTSGLPLTCVTPDRDPQMALERFMKELIEARSLTLCPDAVERSTWTNGHHMELSIIKGMSSLSEGATTNTDAVAPFESKDILVFSCDGSWLEYYLGLGLAPRVASEQFFIPESVDQFKRHLDVRRTEGDAPEWLPLKLVGPAGEVDELLREFVDWKQRHGRSEKLMVIADAGCRINDSSIKAAVHVESITHKGSLVDRHAVGSYLCQEVCYLSQQQPWSEVADELSERIDRAWKNLFGRIAASTWREPHEKIDRFYQECATCITSWLKGGALRPEQAVPSPMPFEEAAQRVEESLAAFGRDVLDGLIDSLLGRTDRAGGELGEGAQSALGDEGANGGAGRAGAASMSTGLEADFSVIASGRVDERSRSEGTVSKPEDFEIAVTKRGGGTTR